MPKTIAIIGASADRSKFGNKALRAHLAEGWRVYPINPSGGTIEGLEVSERLADLDVELDRVSVYLPPHVTRALLPEIKAAQPQEVWFNPGAADDGVLSRARDLGLVVRNACGIVDIGRSPSEFN